ncbi:MAG: pyridoxamine 5'-phosphate oxidase [Actinomycetes bacterium]|nr:MAG: pyridoxamine 5'-phosphate oxidase [Actinomycetes bacterium]
MGKVFDEISDHLRGWIGRQALFFVATAPLDGEGHVNVSPKGPVGSLAVLGPRRIAYLDVNGSGSETIAHLRENGRICVMLCAFEGPPRIVRLHGRGEAIQLGDPRFDELLAAAEFEDPSIPEARRSIVDVEVTRISDSCGYGVPLMSFDGLREHHPLLSAKRIRTMGLDDYRSYQRERGARSIDGLPAQEPLADAERPA